MYNGLPTLTIIEFNLHMYFVGRKYLGNFSVAVLFVTVLCAALLYFLYHKFLVVAVVDGVSITRWRVVTELESNSGGRALQEIIIKKLTVDAISKANIEVSDAEVDADINLFKIRLKSQGDTLNDVLVQLGPRGMTEEEFRVETRDILAEQKLLTQWAPDAVNVTDSEVLDYIKASPEPLFQGMAREDVPMQVKVMLQRQKFGDVRDRWRAEAMKKSDIEINSSYLPFFLPRVVADQRTGNPVR